MATERGCRVDHTGAKIPPPTPDLLMAMAKNSFGAMMSRALVAPCEWNDLDEYNQDAFLEVAKRCYGTVAMFGGAKLRPIKEPE